MSEESNVSISPDLRNSFEDETVLAAANTYFLNNFMDMMQEKHLSPQRGIERSLIEEMAEEAATRASKDMDGTPITAVVGDHCLHWHVTLIVGEGVLDRTLTSEQIPLTKTNCGRMHMLHPMNFLCQFLNHAAMEANAADNDDPGINPGKIQKVCRRIEELLETCDACKNLVTLTEVVFKGTTERGPNAHFCFRLIIDDGLGTGAITYELPWPLV